jgi:hypothetical protein
MEEDISVDQEQFKEVDGYQAGGRVKETGLAVVHKDEYIVPAAGSEAVIEKVELRDQTVINYYFPVEIVVAGSLSEEEHDAIQAGIWEKLSDALEAMA